MAQTILVIDDSPIVRNVHSVMLKTAGFEVVEANDGQEGLNKAMETQLDLMVVDLNTPTMDGYEFCERIRKSGKYPVTPIMVVSTESAEADKLRAFKAGANLFLVKPVKAEELIENVKLLLK